MDKKLIFPLSLALSLTLSGCNQLPLSNPLNLPFQTPTVSGQESAVLSTDAVAGSNSSQKTENNYPAAPIPIYQLVHEATVNPDNAFRTYLKYAIEGFPDCQFLLGVAYIEGTGTPVDMDEGLKWVSKAAKQGVGNAQNYLGLFYGGARDFVEAQKWLALAIDNGNVEALFSTAELLEIEQSNCLELTKPQLEHLARSLRDLTGEHSGYPEYHLAKLSSLGFTETQDKETILEYFKEAANQGHEQACLTLGRMYSTGAELVEADPQQAFAYYSQAAEYQNPSGEYATGLCYTIGNGTDKDLAKGIQLIKSAADQNYPQAQTMLGHFYSAGLDIPKNIELALEYLNKAIAQNEPEAMFILGKLYLKGEDVEPDREQAHNLILRAAELGSDDACVYLGRALMRGAYGFSEDQPVAFSYFYKAANNSDPVAELEVGRSYELGTGVPKDHETAFQWYRRAAGDGNADAKFLLGKCFMNGIGTPAVPEIGQRLLDEALKNGSAEAFEFVGTLLLKKYREDKDPETATKAFDFAVASAKQGNDKGQYLLSYLYSEGISVTQNDVVAMRLLEQSAEQGYLPAQYVLAENYRTGKYVERNLSKALELYTNSAQHGFHFSQFRLGHLYLTGSLVERDEAKAAHWFSLAAKQGNAEAEHNLAIMYRTGQGVERDLRKALEYAESGCKHGGTTAVCNLVTHLRDEIYAKQFRP